MAGLCRENGPWYSPATLKQTPRADTAISEITAALQSWNYGDPDALHQLFPLVFQDLQRTAQVYMAQEDPSHTLQATEIVSEIYFRMVGQRKVYWENRAQFFGFAGELIKRFLVDYARHRRSQKRGGDLEIIPLTGGIDQESTQLLDTETILDVNISLEKLKQLDPQTAKIVELGYFAGMTQSEISEALGISRSTVQRDWAMAKRWFKLRRGDKRIE